MHKHLKIVSSLKLSTLTIFFNSLSTYLKQEVSKEMQTNKLKQGQQAAVTKKVRKNTLEMNDVL